MATLVKAGRGPMARKLLGMTPLRVRDGDFLGSSYFDRAVARVRSPMGMSVLGTRGLRGLGQGEGEVAAVAAVGAVGVLATVALASAGLSYSAIHGYARNGKSLGWGIAWGLGAAVVPFGPLILPVVAMAQGFAKPKG